MEVTHNNLPQAISCLLEEIGSLKALFTQSKDREPNSHERLTIKEVTEQYKVCKATIHNLMNRGTLPYIKIGRKTLFKREDLEDIFSCKSSIKQK